MKKIALLAALIAPLATAQTVTVKLPNKFTAADLVHVEVTDSGRIDAIYNNQGRRYKVMCGTTAYMLNFEQGKPREQICEAAIEAVRKANQ